MNEEEWQKVVERGPFVINSYEPARPAGELFAFDNEGELDSEDVVGYMPETYFDRRFADYFYYSFTAIIPDEDEIGCYYRCTFDEDQGSYDFSQNDVEIEGSPFNYMSEKDFVENNYVYQPPVRLWKEETP